MTGVCKRERLACMHGVLMQNLTAMAVKEMWLAYAIYMYVMYA